MTQTPSANNLMQSEVYSLVMQPLLNSLRHLNALEYGAGFSRAKRKSGRHPKAAKGTYFVSTRNLSALPTKSLDGLQRQGVRVLAGVAAAKNG